jgi:hypothetical protein
VPGFKVWFFAVITGIYEEVLDLPGVALLSKK